MSDETIFSDALAIVDPTERKAYLDRVCPDWQQRNRILDLLQAAQRSNPLDRPPNGLVKTGAFVPEPVESEPLASVGDRVGPYKLLEKIGEGGMGEVWVADQLEPIKRRVALKLIKPGMDSRSVLGRFEAERQALAVMDHPNIAKVLDAGTTTDGRPYFVMELVKGTPITEFCDARKLTPKQRLELFVPVCQAIQHAHMKGIIHRDIKPSNVLVALHDEVPVPKVIDFGVAKAIGQQLTEKTIYTGFGALVGTPAYMAPEQATFNQLDVDTRADVYALGVLLYELLAGSPPIEAERMRKAALDEVLRIVRDEEPPRPSARLSTSQAKASIAATRQSDPAKLSALMKGEIDWIVMKALEKDRTRRYDTANGLAKDIQRYLSGDSVEACPPTLGYQLRKAYRKNRAAVRVGGAFTLLMLLAVVVSSLLAMKARRAETEAKQAMELAEEKQTESEQNLKTSEWYLERYSNAIWEMTEDRAKAEVELKNRKIDIALLELKRDSRLGVLLLAATHASDTGKFSLKMPNFINGSTTNTIALRNVAGYMELNEFITAAVLTTGQNYAPLLPPLTRDGAGVRSCLLSSDARVAMTLGYGGTVKLWDSATARSIAILREKNEHVLLYGFSPDGTTAVTDDLTGVARFWDAATGKLKAKTVARPERYQRPLDWSYQRIADRSWSGAGFRTHTYGDRAFQLQNQRLLTGRVVLQPRPDGAGSPGDEHRLLGPAELWDTTTGALIATFATSKEPDQFKVFLLDGGRYVAVIEEGFQTVVYSADDGRLLTRLKHDDKVDQVFISPSGKRLGTRSSIIRVWDTATWQEDSAARTVSLPDVGGYFAFLSEQTLVVSGAGDGFYASEILELGKGNSLKSYVDTDVSGRSEPNLAFLSDGRLFDTLPWKRMVPPAGRKYHPDLVLFAPDQRFVVAGLLNAESDLRQLFPAWIDIVADKACPSVIGRYWQETPWQHREGFGLARCVMTYGPEVVQVQVVPTSRLDIPPALLQLWAQVVVRGELGLEGEFVKWDEPTWEKKRQELAAAKPPYPDFPFPGYVAQDKLHWLRKEFEEATDNDKLGLATKLLRRAEEIGDKNEAIRWRREGAKRTPELAPPPREKK